MTTYAKPSVLPAWGETNTTSADMVQPANAAIQTGFPLSATPPARQTFNWLLNWASNAIRYFMQRGLADYDAAETYSLNSRCIGDDGNTYVSIQAANIGNTPSTSPTWWVKWGLKISDVASVVAAGGLQFAPSAGLAFAVNTALTNAVVGSWGQIQAGGVTVTLPSISAVAEGQTFTFVKGNYAGTIAASGADHVEGAASIPIGVGESITVVSDGVSGWFVAADGVGANSPAFTGTPTAPTPASTDSSTKLATTAFCSALATAASGVPQVAILGADAAVPANTQTTVLSLAVTFPSVGNTYRVDLRYLLWATVGAIFNAAVIDTLNNIAFASSGQDSGGSANIGLAASQISSQTYAAGATVTFHLVAIANSGSTARQVSQVDPMTPSQSSYLQITPILAS